jgi:hypothetical protein
MKKEVVFKRCYDKLEMVQRRNDAKIERLKNFGMMDVFGMRVIPAKAEKGTYFYSLIVFQDSNK